MTEALAVIFSSTGIMGTVIACLLRKAMRNAEKEAEKRRKARLEEDLVRYELDSTASVLLIALTRYARGLCTDEELDIAEANYTACAVKSDMLIKRHYLEARNAKK